MKFRHEAAILILFAALKEKNLADRRSIYDSLALLVKDVEAFFEERAQNAQYMKEKASLFLEACKVVAELDAPPNDLKQSIDYAAGNLVKLQNSAQWK